MRGKRLACVAMGLILLCSLCFATVPAGPSGGAPVSSSPIRGSTPNNDSEPNNDFDNASLIEGSRSFGGGVGMGDSFDYYRIWLNTAPSPGADADLLKVELKLELGRTSLRIFDTYRRELLMQFPSGAGETLSASFVAHVSGYHYIQFQDNGPCNYTLTTTITAAPFTSDGDNDQAGATDIDAAGCPYQTSSTLNNSTDIYDLYKIRLNSTPGVAVDVVKVFLQVPKGADFNLQLYRGAGATAVAESINLVEGFNETFTYPAAASDDHYLRVWAPTGGGTYTLMVKRFTGTSDGNNALEHASEMIQTDVHWYNTTGDLALGIDPDDYYQISGVVTGQVFNCTVSSLDYDTRDMTPNIRIILLNSSGVEIPPDPEDNLARPTAEANAVSNDAGRMFVQLNLTRWAGGYDLRVYTNAPPQVLKAVPNVSIPENGTSTDLRLASVFEDPDGDPLEFSYELYGAIAGNLDVSVGSDPDRTVTLTPRTGWTGAGWILWTAADPSGLTASAVQELVLVHRINHRPEVLNPSPSPVVLEKNIPDFSSLNMKNIFYDPDGDKLWYNVTGNVSIRVTFARDKVNGIDHTGEVTLVPEMGFVGFETLVFTATDNGLPVHLTSDAVSVLVEVREKVFEERLTVVPIPAITIPEDGEDSSLDLAAYFSSNAENDTFTFELVPQEGSHIAASLSGSIVTLRPEANWSGIETLIFNGTCSHGLATSATVAVEVTPVNDPPGITDRTPAGASVTVSEGEWVVFRVNATDLETPETHLKLRWSRDGVNVSSTNSYNFTTGFDTVRGASSAVFQVNLSVSDGELSVELNWTVTVLNVNRPPVGLRILSPMSNAAYDEGTRIRFWGTAEDEDGDSLSYTWWEGEKQLGAGDYFNYSKLKPGKHTITLKVSDGEAEGSATVVVKINEKKSPGPGAPGLAAATAIALILLRRRRGRLDN